MLIGSIKEQDSAETRVSLTPDVVKQLIADGHSVMLEKGYGLKAGFADKDYLNAKASLIENPDIIYKKSQIILQVLPPLQQKIELLTDKQTLIADFRNFIFTYIPKDLNIIRLELVPRTSIAQSIDILSAQNTIRGYMGALYALYHSPRIAPQLMTAAASIKAATTLIIGTSVTGLQAATVFKRQGCRVTIVDINEKSKELAQSVGADFAMADNKEELTKLLTGKNFILSAAATPNGNSPQVMTTEQLDVLANGAVVTDTTTQNIGIKDNFAKNPHYHFHRNLYFERLAPDTASVLWANNMYNLISLISKENNQIDLSLNYIAPMVYTPRPSQFPHPPAPFYEHPNNLRQ
ncbi:MAG: hypothetical protein J6C85_02750 [Alphaproteobacteria bacterium]|nr:hypothetical protein [Alphaproteobacteria bacterium]